MAVPHRASGPIVKAIRLALGRPAVEIARAVTMDKRHTDKGDTDKGHMDKGYLSSIESGRRSPSPAVTRKIADALGVPEPVLTGQLPVIATLREAQRIAPQEFARDIGVTTGRLRRLEQGSELPDPALVAVISQRLGVDAAVIGPTSDEVAS